MYIICQESYDKVFFYIKNRGYKFHFDKKWSTRGSSAVEIYNIIKHSKSSFKLIIHME